MGRYQVLFNNPYHRPRHMRLNACTPQNRRNKGKKKSYQLYMLIALQIVGYQPYKQLTPVIFRGVAFPLTAFKQNQMFERGHCQSFVPVIRT
jgi:hypothetical protein